MVAGYEFYVSQSTSSWGTAVATGTFGTDRSGKRVSFPAKAGRYIRLYRSARSTAARSPAWPSWTWSDPAIAALRLSRTSPDVDGAAGNAVEQGLEVESVALDGCVVLHSQQKRFPQ